MAACLNTVHFNVLWSAVQSNASKVLHRKPRPQFTAFFLNSKSQLSSDVVILYDRKDKDDGSGINWAEHFPGIQALAVTHRGIVTPDMFEKLLADLSPLKLRRLVMTQDSSTLGVTWFLHAARMLSSTDEDNVCLGLTLLSTQARCPVLSRVHCCESTAAERPCSSMKMAWHSFHLTAV